MHGAQRWLERDRDARVPMTSTRSASATWPAPPPIDCLLVPIFDTGEVRRYNVGFGCDATSPYEVFVSSGGSWTEPWFMTFGNTDPKTLEYRE